MDRQQTRRSEQERLGEALVEEAIGRMRKGDLLVFALLIVSLFSVTGFSVTRVPSLLTLRLKPSIS